MESSLLLFDLPHWLKRLQTLDNDGSSSVNHFVNPAGTDGDNGKGSRQWRIWASSENRIFLYTPSLLVHPNSHSGELRTCTCSTCSTCTCRCSLVPPLLSSLVEWSWTCCWENSAIWSMAEGDFRLKSWVFLQLLNLTTEQAIIILWWVYSLTSLMSLRAALGELIWVNISLIDSV